MRFDQSFHQKMSDDQLLFLTLTARSSFRDSEISVPRFSQLKDVLKVYQDNGDVERAYDTLVSGNWARTFLMGKPRSQIQNFKDHVSSLPCVMQNKNLSKWD